jgi:hypothetical protein
VYEERKNESAPWNSTAKLIRKIACENTQSGRQGEGYDEIKNEWALSNSAKTIDPQNRVQKCAIAMAGGGVR